MNPTGPKYVLRCHSCKQEVGQLRDWFEAFQTCPGCGGKRAVVHYTNGLNGLDTLLQAPRIDSFYHYLGYLPLDSPEHIISFGEGHIPVDRWEFLERYARERFGLEVEVWAYRNDLNQGTGTFKDVAGSMTASALLESGIRQFCAASTGNIATALAKYLAKAGVSFAVFVPSDALESHVAEISYYGQRVFRVRGDYALAKAYAADYSNRNRILISGGNVDPMRVEAKKTQVFEWLRQRGRLPDVYVQALSGGTGPIAIEKAVDELREDGQSHRLPRMLLVQPSGCDPMTRAWERARAASFPQGFEKEYPIIDNPQTLVPTLATGNPATYPIISQIVKRSGGDILSFDEALIFAVGRWVGFESQVKIGPASAIAVGGFLESLAEGLIKSGETVLINVGEGADRAPEYMKAMIHTTIHPEKPGDCEAFDRKQVNPGFGPF